MTAEPTYSLPLFEKLESHLRNKNYTLQPYTNHPLLNHDYYTVNQYLEMLSFVFHTSPSTSTAAKFHLQRIVYSIVPEEDMMDYLRNSMDMDEEQLDQFVTTLAPLELKYSFLVDSLVLLHLSDNIEQAQYQFLATLSQHLNISDEKLEILSQLSKCTLEQDVDGYIEVMKMDGADVFEEHLVYYTDEYIPHRSIFSKEIINIRSRSNVNINVVLDSYATQELNLSSERIILENFTIDTNEWTCDFSNSEYILVRDCTFLGSIRGIHINNSADVVFENCRFSGFPDRTLYIEDVENFKLINCEFMKCKYRYTSFSDNWVPLGGVIYSSRPSNVTSFSIDSCSFKDSGGINSRSYYVSAIISNCIAKVENSQFTNCWHYNYGDELDPENSLRTLFPPQSSNINNKITNSANFN